MTQQAASRDRPRHEISAEHAQRLRLEPGDVYRQETRTHGDAGVPDLVLVAFWEDTRRGRFDE
ncbi:hypothetical protein CJ179_49040 [Rhodococcus sp. ACS1]|nr:hypothetical protein CJ179_49040 [Rhodococcus sp. ACS1]